MYEYIHIKTKKKKQERRNKSQTISQKYVILVLIKIRAYLFRNSISFVPKIKLRRKVCSHVTRNR
jgi:hypothetical protein